MNTCFDDEILEGDEYENGDETLIYTEWDCKNPVPEGFTGIHKRVGRPSLQNELNGLKRQVSRLEEENEEQKRFNATLLQLVSAPYVILAVVEMVYAVQRVAIHKFGAALNVSSFRQLSKDQIAAKEIEKDCTGQPTLLAHAIRASGDPFESLRKQRNRSAHPQLLAAELKPHLDNLHLVPPQLRTDDVRNAIKVYAYLQQIPDLDKVLLEARVLAKAEREAKRKARLARQEPDSDSGFDADDDYDKMILLSNK